MKKTALLAVLVLALGGAGLEAGIGVADFKSNVERSKVRYTANYDNPLGGRWHCVGFRIVVGSLTSDVQECSFTDLSTFPPGIYVGNPDFIVNGSAYIWNSDYDGVTANQVVLVITANPDGTGHATVTAFY